MNKARALQIFKRMKREHFAKREKKVVDFWQFAKKYLQGTDYISEYSYMFSIVESALAGRNLIVAKGSQVGATHLAMGLELFFLAEQQKNIFHMMPTIPFPSISFF